jgi:hypothetical protein
MEQCLVYSMVINLKTLLNIYLVKRLGKPHLATAMSGCQATSTTLRLWILDHVFGHNAQL